MAQIVTTGVRMVPARLQELGYDVPQPDLEQAWRDARQVESGAIAPRAGALRAASRLHQAAGMAAGQAVAAGAAAARHRRGDRRGAARAVRGRPDRHRQPPGRRGARARRRRPRASTSATWPRTSGPGAPAWPRAARPGSSSRARDHRRRPDPRPGRAAGGPGREHVVHVDRQHPRRLQLLHAQHAAEVDPHDRERLPLQREGEPGGGTLAWCKRNPRPLHPETAASGAAGVEGLPALERLAAAATQSADPPRPRSNTSSSNRTRPAKKTPTTTMIRTMSQTRSISEPPPRRQDRDVERAQEHHHEAESSAVSERSSPRAVEHPRRPRTGRRRAPREDQRAEVAAREPFARVSNWASGHLTCPRRRGRRASARRCGRRRCRTGPGASSASPSWRGSPAR